MRAGLKGPTVEVRTFRSAPMWSTTVLVRTFRSAVTRIIQAPARLGDSHSRGVCHHRVMTNDLLASISNQLADAVGVAAPSIVQVQGRRRPASGLVYANDVVVTTVRALGREDGLHVRRHDGATRDAELAGWDPTTNLAVLRVAGLEAPPMALATADARVGHLARAV